MPKNVATPNVAYETMAKRWTVMDDLLSGTEGMRSKRETYLPREPKEQSQQYDVRLKRSFLFPAFEDTVNKVVSKPFSKPVTMRDEAPAELVELEKNCDGQGTTLSTFAKQWFQSAVIYGLSHVFVDMPKMPEETTRADEVGITPRFILVEPPALIGWRSELSPDGVPYLTQVRWKETREEPDGDYADKEINYIRVVNADGTWELWREHENQSWVVEEEGTHTYPGVPLVTLYAERTSFMRADPPMYELAMKNIEHWQASSDHRNTLRFASIGILFFRGLSEEDVRRETIIGPNRVIKSSSKDADGKYIEQTGAAIGAMEKHIEKIERQMEVLGAEPFVQRSNDTATGKVLASGKQHSAVQEWVRDCEAALLEAYAVAATWKGVELSDDFSLDVFSDFIVELTGAGDGEQLLKMRVTGQITHKTYLREVKRRGVLSETVNEEDEIEELASEVAGVEPEPEFEDDDDVE